MSPGSAAAPVVALLHWSLRRDLRSRHSWIAGAFYVGFAGLQSLALLRVGPAGAAGSDYLPFLIQINFLAAVYFAVSRAAETAADRTTGLLGLIKITGLSPPPVDRIPCRGSGGVVPALLVAASSLLCPRDQPRWSFDL